MYTTTTSTSSAASATPGTTTGMSTALFDELVWKGKITKEKLEDLGMLSLEDRRIRYDMVQVYKILYKFDDVDHGE